MWTRFGDMHSGGDQKTQFDQIYIEAERAEAIDIFKKAFDRDPYNETCECCGEDYSITEYDSLESATSYGRIKFPMSRGIMTLDEYEYQSDVKIIRRV